MSNAEGPVRGKRYKTKDAAFWLSMEPRQIAAYYRKGEVFKPGTEIFKLGTDLRINVCAFLDRIAEEQKAVRRV